MSPNRTGRHDGAESWRFVEGGAGEYVAPAGRWPTNVTLDDTQAAELDRQSGVSVSKRSAGRNGTNVQGATGIMAPRAVDLERGHDDQGGASRFFPTFRYQAKAPTRERPKVDGVAHPTVKPLTLMRWLVRLVTPPGGLVLEPFAGSGTTLQAARAEGFRCIGIERETEYLPLILARLGVTMPASSNDVAEPVDPLHTDTLFDPAPWEVA